MPAFGQLDLNHDPIMIEAAAVFQVYMTFVYKLLRIHTSQPTVRFDPRGESVTVEIYFKLCKHANRHTMPLIFPRTPMHTIKSVFPLASASDLGRLARLALICVRYPYLIDLNYNGL